MKTSTAFQTLKLNKGDTFNLLSGLNLDKGKWVALLDISFIDDKYDQTPSGFYYLDKIEDIKQMQQELIVTYNGADCCTTESGLSFIKNDTLAFWTGFISGPYGGFQNKNYGWTEPLDSTIFNRLFRHFKICEQFKQTIH